MTEEDTRKSVEETVPTRVVLRDLLIEMKQRDRLFEDYIEHRSKSRVDGQ